MRRLIGVFVASLGLIAGPIGCSKKPTDDTTRGEVPPMPKGNPKPITAGAPQKAAPVASENKTPE
jgi:hypothetical protein